MCWQGRSLWRGLWRAAARPYLTKKLSPWCTTRGEGCVAPRAPSILEKRPNPMVHTRVDVDNEVSDAFTVIDIHTQDRIGLLYTITSTLSKLGLYIHIAKIATKGDEAADIFYVKDIFGQKIYYKERLKEIRKTIFEALGEKAPGEEEE